MIDPERIIFSKDGLVMKHDQTALCPRAPAGGPRGSTHINTLQGLTPSQGCLGQGTEKGEVRRAGTGRPDTAMVGEPMAY